MTVQELINLLEEMPKDALLVKYHTDLETSGIKKAYLRPKLKKFRQIEKETYDTFDGGYYTYTAYLEDPNGECECVEL